MATVLLDTEILYCFLTNSERLPAGARQRINKARELSELALSVISIAELRRLRDLGKIDNAVFEELDKAVGQFPATINVLPIDHGTVLHFDTAPQGVRLSGRVVAATARQYAATLITANQALNVPELDVICVKLS